VHAVILAAGEGRKIFPYDLTRQKAALPVGNTPLVRWTVDCLRKAGVDAISVVVGYREERVRNALHGVEGMRFVRQGERSGTVAAALAGLEGADEWPALVVYGDVLIDEEGLAGFVRDMAEKKPFAAAMLAPMGGRDTGNWIVGGLDGDRLAGVSGHDRGGSYRMAGVYALSAEAAPHLEGNPGVMESVPVGGMPPMEGEVAQSFQMMVDDGREVMAALHSGLFVDIDKPWHFLEANERFAEYLCGRIEETRIGADAAIDDGADVAGKIVLGDGARIGKRVVVKGNLIVGPNTTITNGAMVGGNCVIGRESRVRDYCMVDGGTVVGSGCIVGHGAEMGGLLLDGAYLYHYCEMSGVFGARFDAGAATVCGTLRFDDGETTHVVRGRRETPECNANCTYVGDYTRTGVNAILMPGVKVGAYSCVGPGVILYDDVEHGTLVLAKQEQVRKPWGPEKYGW
jgi:bifunctional UDP-N-acetylglucosamine pyrophosphorylase/glucosamine-1-phosphate N-acetyltransferase